MRLRAAAGLLVAHLAFAEGAAVKQPPRTQPPLVAPVVVQLERFEQNVAYPGYLFVVSARSGELLYIQQVYPERSRAQREDGAVLFKSMKLGADGQSLDIVNEKDEKFHVTIREKERGSDWPSRVELVAAQGTGPKRSLKVRLTIPNPSKRPLRIDGLSAASGGELLNHVFRLAFNGTPIRYQGEMVKRAPPDPDDFIVVKPGASYSTEVELGQTYELPPAGRVDVRFETFNHFSPDEVTFKSNILEVELPSK